jgi:hypothetical protein
VVFVLENGPKVIIIQWIDFLTPEMSRVMTYTCEVAFWCKREQVVLLSHVGDTLQQRKNIYEADWNFQTFEELVLSPPHHSVSAYFETSHLIFGLNFLDPEKAWKQTEKISACSARENMQFYSLNSKIQPTEGRK